MVFVEFVDDGVENGCCCFGIVIYVGLECHDFWVGGADSEFADRF